MTQQKIWPEPFSVEIIHGDCIHELAILSRAKKHARLIFADSPYNQDVDYGVTTNDRRSRAQFVSWCRQWIGECYINLVDNGSLWTLISHEYGADIEMILRDTGFTVVNWITWYESFGVNCKNKFTRSSRRLFHAVKDPEDYLFNREPVTRPSARQTRYHDKRANPAGRLWDDVFGINPPIPRVCGTHAERIQEFPTQLPIKLLDPIIRCASNPGDLVVDPFSGSGTTMESCLRAGRTGIGIEINGDYVAKSRIRLESVRSEIPASGMESS